MANLKHLFFKSKYTKPEKAKVEFTDPPEKNTEDEKTEQQVDYNCIASDFTGNMLVMEMMRLGHDPANMDKKQMIEILYQHMESNKPVAIESIAKE